MSDNVKIIIPKAKNDEVTDIPSGSNIGEINKKVDQLHYLLIAIVASVIISGIAVVIAVIGLFIDQMHYNNAAYTEYYQQEKSNNNIQQQYNDKVYQMIKNQQEILNKIK